MACTLEKGCYTIRGLRRWLRRLRWCTTQAMNAAAKRHHMTRPMSAALEAMPHIFCVPWSSAAVVVISSCEPSSGTAHDTLPSATVPVADVSLPGRCAWTVTCTASVGPAVEATTCSAYGVAPTAARTSGSANAASPSMRREPLMLTVVPPSSTVRVTSRLWSGPPAPLIDCSNAVASSGFENVWVSSTRRPPSPVELGSETVHPAAFASSNRRSSANPGAWLTTSASATAVTVMWPLPSPPIVMSTVVSTRQAASNITNTTMKARRIVSDCGMWNLPGTGGVWTDEPSSMTTEPKDPSDADLVTRARAGDVSAFVALIRRYQPSALRLAAAISGSVDDAADIAQEDFVKAHRSLPTLSDPTIVKSWMLRIVANEAKNHVRGRNRRRRRDERYGSWAVVAAADPEATAVTADDAHRLSLALGAIKASDRQVLAYRYFAGLSEVETAAAVGVALGTVKSRTARALVKLRAELEKP